MGAIASHIKSGQGAKKGPHLLASFELSAINQYFLVTLFTHRVNLRTFKFPNEIAHSDKHILFRKNILWKLLMIFS